MAQLIYMYICVKSIYYDTMEWDWPLISSLAKRKREKSKLAISKGRSENFSHPPTSHPPTRPKPEVAYRHSFPRRLAPTKGWQSEWFICRSFPVWRPCISRRDGPERRGFESDLLRSVIYLTPKSIPLSWIITESCWNSIYMRRRNGYGLQYLPSRIAIALLNTHRA